MEALQRGRPPHLGHRLEALKAGRPPHLGHRVDHLEEERPPHLGVYLPLPRDPLAGTSGLVHWAIAGLELGDLQAVVQPGLSLA